MSSSGIIMVLAYPETIVRVSTEWTASIVYLLGIGKKNYVRAGHAALVLIDKANGSIDYYDFGRYVTPLGKGRVRSKLTDHELDFKLQAELEDNTIINLDELLIFLATHPQWTHGDGKMLASVCHEIDFNKAKKYIETLQNEGLVKYAAFGKVGSNCSRFVTDTLIASINSPIIKKRLLKSKLLTPSTIGNVLLANTQNKIYEVSIDGSIDVFKSSKFTENRKLFFDRLRHHQPDKKGNLEPVENTTPQTNAQWLGGVGSGAWFELHYLGPNANYRFKRISPYGSIDVDGIYKILGSGFDIREKYEFVYYSNCHFFHIKQQEIIYRFDFIKKLEAINSVQTERSI